MPSELQTVDSSNSSPITSRALVDAMNRYTKYRAIRGSTAQGLYAVRRYLGDFIAWCQARQVDRLELVDPKLLEDYQYWLHTYRQKNGQPLAPTSRLAKFVPLRGWFKWLKRTGTLILDPAADIELPRASRTLPRGLLTLANVKKLLGEPNTTSIIGLRDRAMLEVLFSTGLRRMELARLEIQDLNLDRLQLVARNGKGRKDRILPVGERAAHWLSRYLTNSRDVLAGETVSRYVFVGRGGHGLSLSWLSTIVSKHMQAAGLGKGGSCHLLRHAMATLMLEGGADVRYIQAMLGHAQLTTTQIYTHIAIGRLQAVHAATHPGAQLGNSEE